MNETIKNPSLIPEWFITSADGKVYGIRDASGNEHVFVGSSEKGADGKDGKTPALKINNEDGFKWQVNYDNGQGWIDVPGSPAASGMVGPQGEKGPSGNSIVLQSTEQVEGGVKVTLAWGENESETSAFVIPSGAPGSSYTFDQTTTSGDGSDKPIGVNTNVIATKDDLDDYVKRDALLPENGISGDYVDNKYHFGLATSGIDANKQYAWTTSGWKEVTAQGTITAGTDLVLDSGVMKVNTNGVANEAGMAFVEGNGTVASGAASHAEGKETSAYGDYSHIEGYRNTEQKINGLAQANHVEGSYNSLKGVYSHLEGNANGLSGYGVHMQGAYNIFAIKNTSADKSDPEGRWNIWGQSIEGMANKTTSEPISGYDGSTPLYTHGGILKVIGNGTRTKTDESDPESEVITRSDALILYRDGSMWVQGPISANGVELGNYSPTLPLNIGNNNTVASDSIGAIGNNCTAGSKSIVMSYQGATAINNSLAVGDDNYASANAGAFGWHASATDYGFALGHYVKARNYSVAFGHGDSSHISTADNYSIINGDAVSAFNYSQAFGRGIAMLGGVYDDGSGQTVEVGGLAIGGWNKTTSGALFVIGNGSYRTTNGAKGKSDALVVDYAGNATFNGSVSARVADGKNIFAVASAASLIGASRQTSENYGVNNTAIGTTWFGVGSNGMHQGFIKYTDGGDVGALDSNSMIQLNFKPSTNNYDSVQVQINGSTVGNLIPAQVHTGSYTPTSDDGILHIVVES